MGNTRSCSASKSIFASKLARTLALTLALAVAAQAKSGMQAPAGTPAENEPLKLLISVEQQSVTAPLPVRLTLHVHNSGREPLWLYRRVRDRARPREVRVSEETANMTAGGSTLAVRLEPVESQSPSQTTEPAEGKVLESVGLPHPRLFRLGPDEDAEERAVIQISPATAASGDGKKRPLWGRYRLSVTYGAEYSNAEEIARNLRVKVWRGEVTSNAVEMELRPTPADAPGSVAGTVVGSDGRARRDVIVSLSDQQERLVAQVLTDPEGRFSFTGLSFGLYWVTARLESSTTDTTVFRHAELTPDQPAGTIELVMLPKEIYEPKAILHKPVLFRLTDSADRPLDKVNLQVTWSNGSVLDNVTGQTIEDGTVTLDLIPGRNFATLKRRGCPKDEKRVDVTQGDGIDDFKLALDCAGR